jgi:hypothetical protein
VTRRLGPVDCHQNVLERPISRSVSHTVPDTVCRSPGRFGVIAARLWGSQRRQEGPASPAFANGETQTRTGDTRILSRGDDSV